MKAIPFEKTKDGSRMMAAFIVELTARGAEYDISFDCHNWFVTVVGF